EVLNAKSLERDPFDTFRDWFALLNRGHRIFAVAGSDSHTVDGIVGQARTYVRSSTDDPSRADVEEISKSFLDGRLLVSMGLIVDAVVDGKYRVGDVALRPKESRDAIRIDVDLQGASWVAADRLYVILNGAIVSEIKVKHDANATVKFRETIRVPRPAHDAHLVLIARGPEPKSDFWPMADDDRYALAATNPIWIDGDGDGEYSSPREYAQEIAKSTKLESTRLSLTLAAYDQAVRVQVASLVRSQFEQELQKTVASLRSETEKRLVTILGEEGDLIRHYRESIPDVSVSLLRGDKKKKR
ncbi:MAG: hypothetical protein AAF517_20065, partial [Planctomycetota bacterium]